MEQITKFIVMFDFLISENYLNILSNFSIKLSDFHLLHHRKSSKKDEACIQNPNDFMFKVNAKIMNLK
jgi:hypothetical protein